MLRPASSASSVSEPGLSQAISSKRCLLCSDSNFAKLSIEVNHTFGSPFAGVCSPRAIVPERRLEQRPGFSGVRRRGLVRLS